ncbi:DUF4435 domain-containing protein [Flavobacterium sp. LS1P28]|jgi:ABC-type dipeptide/oligopeptide/nickel transport system ATPase component|uniref:DUF4435 domain-containing protein n=1 Tax=Flavobacterium sp. LS1P28 TaxID=2497752 RepID=UPI000F83D33A|nr:DUF4435 domain-containing protein [Flavobacterium sp. LS1P28]RTY78577.1 DUF4435 domain-containing protein [Flavobacterium sp. LS1P28]
MKIQLPLKKGTPNTQPEIEFEQLVIIGANGSGKTRFGANIEERYKKFSHRVSAQKTLSIPNFVSTKSKEVAESEFLYGSWDKNDYYKNSGWRDSRWGGNINTFLLNDYEKLMVLLHTEEYESSLNYKEKGGEKPNTKLDRIQKIWEIVLPHRRLSKKAGVIETYPTGEVEQIYNASEMSDGERVIFYLAGEVVCSPENSIIIIDEPEMHIHKSLIKILFDLIENERQDCSFVYLTHDIDFAFTRQNATKIWAKSYESTGLWDYEILDNTMPIPEQLYLEVLGSRKPIIFLEGDNSSIDYEIYEQIYFNYTLKPLGSCDKVIECVKSFNELEGFHNIQSYGIVDRDRRQIGDVINLNKKQIWVLDVAEAENLLLIENIVKALATHMGKNADEVFLQVKSNLISFFSSQLESQILLHYKELLRREYYKLSNFQSQKIDDTEIEINSLFEAINKRELYNNIKSDFETAITNNDYNTVLRLFNLKKALIPESKVCELIGIRNKEEYRKMVITLLKRKDENATILREGIDLMVIKNVT